jgi:hypothetical protein
MTTPWRQINMGVSIGIYRETENNIKERVMERNIIKVIYEIPEAIDIYGNTAKYEEYFISEKEFVDYLIETPVHFLIKEIERL